MKDPSNSEKSWMRRCIWMAVAIGFFFHWIGIVQFFDIHVLKIIVIGSIAASFLGRLQDGHCSQKWKDRLFPILFMVNLAFGFYAGLLLYYSLEICLLNFG